ncbi:MAG TPA: hypothetical protein VK658_03280 [Chryseolinea sp.]|nr:hypothetical protein [Chryseolinea sp.]
MTGSTTWRAYRDELAWQILHPVSTLVFTRALSVVVLLKMLWQWPIRSEWLSLHHWPLPHGPLSGPLLLPARFANAHPHVFFFAASLFLVVHLAVRRNYFTAALFCALVFNLLMINQPTGDGGDVVAFMLSVWAIFMVPPRATASPYAASIQTVLYNIARLCCCLQFVFLYAASGVDKLKSNLWTTGKAFESMRMAGGIINPGFPAWLATPFWDVTLTWSTILLEIMFGLLIWFRPWQPALILAAVVFHLGIWWMLDLPDFALLMIVAVMIFLRDDQYRKLFKPWLLST